MYKHVISMMFVPFKKNVNGIWIILLLERQSHADLPFILILSVYTDFLPFKFGKILIFFLKIW